MARVSALDLAAQLAATASPVYRRPARRPGRPRKERAALMRRDIPEISAVRVESGEEALRRGHPISWRAIWSDEAPPYPMEGLSDV